MEKNKTKSIVYGFLLINKPVGPTSHDIVDRLRKITGIKKIGHAGTLDPAASGVLLVAVGRQATKKINQFVKLDKKYEAELYLRKVSNTYDKEGEIKEVWPADKPIEIKEVKRVVKDFIGPQLQIPPMFSAKKVKGKKLYELARAGQAIKREPIQIEIYNLKILSYAWPRLKLSVHCSSGTYIRSLAHDIGQRLGCGAYLKALKRTAVGPFEISQTVTLERLERKGWERFLFN